MRSALPSAAYAALLIACAGASPPPVVEEPEEVSEPEEPPTPEVVETPLVEDPPGDGEACFAPEECGEGHHCRGPAGCSTDFACGDERECGEATVSYCGCDAVTFYAPENCPGRPYTNVGPCEGLGEVVEDSPEAVEGSRLCTSDGDCRQGFVCAGLEGCATFWTCVRRRRMRPRCTRREASFCSCEGESFEASATCPGRPILHEGACSGDEPPPEAIAVAPSPAPAPPPVVAPPPSPPAATPPPAVSPPAREPPPISPRTELTPPPPDPPCRSNDDCEGGQTCQGPEGCGGQWRCARPPRRCVSDTQRFCGCDGVTFRASMTCPGRPHQHRGSCPRASE